MTYTADILASAIIAVGRFNPAIFSPDWLEANSLIGRSDADSVRDNNQGSLIVSHQVTSFETKWFSLQVLANQFSLTSKDALSPAFRDLAVSIFQLLPHTPVTAVGLNFMGHFKLASDEEYHNVGDALAPKGIWNTLFPNEIAGLTTLSIGIEPGVRGEPLKTRDNKRISIQPSALIKSGVYIAYNSHHDVSVSSNDTTRSAQRVATIIEQEWEASWHDSVRVFNGLLSMTLDKK
ncbi:MAG: hypothetical protein ACYDBH_16385 [Acidobacteriaceae bacterium]